MSREAALARVEEVALLRARAAVEGAMLGRCALLGAAERRAIVDASCAVHAAITRGSARLGVEGLAVLGANAVFHVAVRRGRAVCHRQGAAILDADRAERVAVRGAVTSRRVKDAAVLHARPLCCRLFALNAE